MASISFAPLIKNLHVMPDSAELNLPRALSILSCDEQGE